MKYFLILGAIAGLCVLGGCGGGNDVARQYPQNADMWTGLGGDAGAPMAVSKVVDDAVSGLLADPKEAPYFAVVGQPGHDSVGRLKARGRAGHAGEYVRSTSTTHGGLP